MSTISWFIPSLIKGSGGHRTILQHASYLERKGHCCIIYLEDEHGIGDASEKIASIFNMKFSNVIYGWKNSKPSDIAIATVWYSAAFVASLNFECKKVYFVQDYEAWFNPMGDAYLMAENSYQYGLTPITIGRWLRHTLKNSFNVDGYHFEFGANLDIYKKIPSIKKEKAVCFIYQPDKPRRCSRLGLEALGIVKHRLPNVKIYLYGSDTKEHVWFEHDNLGLIDLEQCNELYNKCQVGLCLSSSNPSRIPFEMMAAGLPVVEMWRENNFYDLPESAALLAQQTPESLAEAIIRLLSNDELRDKMSQSGHEFMVDRNLNVETEQFSIAINNVLNGNSFSDKTILKMYNAEPIKAEFTREATLSAIHIIAPSRLKKIAMLLPIRLREPLKKIYRIVKGN
ncbi:MULTISPECIES: glycosyltransferase family 4 protein [unclassified Enterobacter]|jgi:glycosyltransferase involved in cell wall biosynthesis|uniref:glycosyltransferase family 4 protein n=1 Tax=unclassified Enterobacter TaxID=2608935 RepID=UPI0015CC13FE|nr:MULTISPECIES: glycosyltransferase family 4 protein [unclassified Enterobacter]MBB3304164.1 glycosyltransferase involved in cell wall biosynthesis [Enterobacter sp. Sphag1F]NYI12731.1 glycosyltransferase involved in cell wall biosynthesis [Enterobacter sp. Sphag71]